MQGNNTGTSHKSEIQTPNSGDDDEWEKVEYEETEEGKKPIGLSGGHFGIKIGTKRWNKTIYSVDWNTRTYEENPGQHGVNSTNEK